MATHLARGVPTGRDHGVRTVQQLLDVGELPARLLEEERAAEQVEHAEEIEEQKNERARRSSRGAGRR